MKLYDDLDTFFAERGLRRRPLGIDGGGAWLEDSYDFGVWWKDDQGRAYRLTWIGPTHRDEGSAGELYAVRLSGPHITPLTVGGQQVIGWMGSAGEASGHVVFFGTIPPSEPGGAIGSMTDLNVETVLAGWEQFCGIVGSLEWVRQAMERAIAEGEAQAP